MVATTIYPLDMWSIFVVNVFGSFWAAVVGLMFLYFLILMLGRVSMYSVIWFMAIFLMCMAIGYGYIVVTIPLVLFIITRFTRDIVEIVGRMRGG